MDAAGIQPLPNSLKMYVVGSRPDIQVPMREISQADTPTRHGRRKEPTDLRLRLLRPLFRPHSAHRYPQRTTRSAPQWIAERGDTHELEQLSSEFSASAPPTNHSTNCASPACTAIRCAQSRARMSVKCTTPGKASSRRKWNTSLSVRTTTVPPM